jgi:hypothetical protein
MIAEPIPVEIPATEPRLFFHEYKAPVPVAITLMELLEQFNTVDPVVLLMPTVGAVISCVTTMLDAAVQPLVAVAVTVYVPGAVMLTAADEPKLLLHEYVEPPVAVTLIAVLEQFNAVDPVLLVIPAVGAVISCVTIMLDVAVQPLVAVAVTVYVPGALMLAAAAEPKLLLHEYVEPPVAVTLIAVLEQFNIVDPVLLVIPAVGVVISCVTIMLEVAVQPLVAFAVTV